MANKIVKTLKFPGSEDTFQVNATKLGDRDASSILGKLDGIEENANKYVHPDKDVEYNDTKNTPIYNGSATLVSQVIADDQGHLEYVEYQDIVLPSAANDGKLTIQKNGEKIAEFTANDSDNVTANIVVPTKLSQLDNDLDFVEEDPTVPSHVKAITEENIISWNAKATTGYVDQKVASLVDSAPGTLDTLNELAAALGDDPNFATTMATEIGKKADKTEIPTVNNATLTIQKNGEKVAEFTANSATNTTANITIPTKLSQFENDLEFQTPDSLAESLGDVAWLDAIAKYNLTSDLQTEIDGKATKGDVTSEVGTAIADFAKDLAKVATSGSYNDLSDKPTLITTSDITTQIDNFADTALGTLAFESIVKKEHLESSVQTSLGKADTALQSHQNISHLATKLEVTSEIGAAISDFSGDLATVAHTGSYNDLTEKPTLLTGDDVDNRIDAFAESLGNLASKDVADKSDLSSSVQTSLGKADTALQTHQDISHLATKSEVNAKATAQDITDQIDNFAETLADVAFSGSYNDLSNKPTIPTVNNATLTIQKNGTTVKTFTANSSTDVTANITVPTKLSELNNDAGLPTSVEVSTMIGDAIDDLAAVAKSGSYTDLSNKPTIPTNNNQLTNGAGYQTASQVTSTVSDAIDNFSDTLHAVASSGNYNDLINKPTIPTVNNGTLTIQKNGTNVATFTANSASGVTANITVPTKFSDLNNDSGLPSSTDVSDMIGDAIDGLASVAKSGSYNDLSNKPSIPTVPTNVSAFVNDADYMTETMVEAYNTTVIQPEIDKKLDASQKGVANGVASLGSDGKVPSSQLPSYVDDVLEYTAKANFPTTGETGKIYIDKTTNKTYRWSGSAYAEISASLALGTTSSTAYAGDKGQEAHDNASMALDKVNSVIAGTTYVPNATYAASAKDYAAGGTIAGIADTASQALDMIQDVIDGGTTVAKASTAASATTATSATTAANYSAGGTIEDIAELAGETRAIVDDILEGGTTVPKATTATNATQLGGVAASSYARTSQLPTFTFENGVLTITTNN